jgi:hypothetical protein
MSRKERRALSKRVPQEQKEKLADQVALFGKLPESCSLCRDSFDQKDRDMLSSWKVVVIQETVRLYCPHCVQKAEKEIDNERS